MITYRRINDDDAPEEAAFIQRVTRVVHRQKTGDEYSQRGHRFGPGSKIVETFPRKRRRRRRRNVVVFAETRVDDGPGCKVEQRSRARQRDSESAFVFDMFTDRVDILDDSEAFVRAVHRRVRWRFARSAVSVGGRSRSRKRGVGF